MTAPLAYHVNKLGTPKMINISMFNFNIVRIVYGTGSVTG